MDLRAEQTGRGQGPHADLARKSLPRLPFELFRTARAQTYDGYVRYWQRHDVEVGEVTIVSSDDGIARVRAAMLYVTGDQRVAEVDELTLRAIAGSWQIIEQSVVR